MSTQPKQPAVSSFEMTQPIQPDKMSGEELVSYFQYKPERDTASDVRNALLVVMALIAAATFQAGLNPPSGVWQDTKIYHGPVNQEAGTAILGSRCLHAGFLFCNTAAFASSIYVIAFLVYRYPFDLLIWIGLISFLVTYSISTIIFLDVRGAACMSGEVSFGAALVIPLVTAFANIPIKKACGRVFNLIRTALEDQSI